MAAISRGARTVLTSPENAQSYAVEHLARLAADGYVLLTPNARLARQIRSAWNARQMAAGRRGWETLPVYPLEAWLLERWREAVVAGYCPARVVLGPTAIQALWQRVIARAQDGPGGYSLLHPSAAAGLAAGTRDRLLRWRVDCARPGIRHDFLADEDCASFIQWQDQFAAALARADLATPVDCLVDLAGSAQSLPRYRAALLEFEDIPPLLQACLDGLCERLEQPSQAPLQARCRVVAFPDNRAELAAVAAWARSTHAQRPAATLGIVLQDMTADRATLEYYLRREFDCLGQPYGSLPVNFSTGITLDRAPLVRDALRVLRMGLGDVSLDELVALTNSPFVAPSDARSPASLAWLERLFELGRERLPLAELQYQSQLGEPAEVLFVQNLDSMTALCNAGQRYPPSEWVERFVRMLQPWSWPGARGLDSLEYQQLEQWQRVLDEFAALDVICPSLELSGALDLLHACLLRQVSQPQTDDSNIQVLGPLEAAGLHFDELWLCGMQAATWPAPARPDPFIPIPLQRALRMPHASAEREAAYAQGLLSQYRRCARVLRASYARQRDGVPELPSALLEEFTPDTMPPASVLDPAWERMRAAGELEQVADASGPPLQGDELESLRGGSSLIEDQARCPFRAFARHRLGAAPPGETRFDPSPAIRGSALHRALYHLFERVPDSASLQALTASEEADAVRAAAQSALAQLPVAAAGGTRAWRELEAERLATLLSEWLEVERGREAFTIVCREGAAVLPLGPLILALRVDRIDRLENGDELVLDYKSGQCRIQDWLGDRPASPQLPLYGLASSHPPAALAFARLRPGECDLVGVGEIELAPGVRSDIGDLVPGGWEVQDWPALKRRWRTQLEGLAEDLLQGLAGVDPLPRACDYCGLQSLCRVDHREPGIET